MAKRKQKLSKEERRLRRGEDLQKAKLEIKAHPVLFTVYVVLRALVVAVLILQLLNQDYYDVFLCSLTLVLFLIPSFVERRLHIDVPNTLEVIILLFIFSAEILGGNPGILLDLPLLGHHAPHHQRISDGRHRHRHGGHPQPLSAVQGAAVPGVRGGGGFLLLHDHRRAYGSFSSMAWTPSSRWTCRRTPGSAW